MSVPYMEEAPPACESYTRAPQEDHSMAGIVRAHLEVHGSATYDVMPEVCPAEDEHTQAKPRCQCKMIDGEVRWCPFFVTLTSPANCSDRKYLRELALDAIALGARQVRCSVICLRQRANRAPGC